jgi:hypothetical protein
MLLRRESSCSSNHEAIDVTSSYRYAGVHKIMKRHECERRNTAHSSEFEDAPLELNAQTYPAFTIANVEIKRVSKSRDAANGQARTEVPRTKEKNSCERRQPRIEICD